MQETIRSYRGMVTAPHHLASLAGTRILQEGGNAIEAMIAAASTIAVVYPHMNGLGGDNFWLVYSPDEGASAIDACGGAAQSADINYYAERGHAAIPERGPMAALTVAGAVAGWKEAHTFSQQRWGGRFPLSRLFEDAIYYARSGIAVTRSQYNNTISKLDQLKGVPGYQELFLIENNSPVTGSCFKNQALSSTLERLAKAGLDDFYRGDIARSLARDLQQAGSPLRLDDFAHYNAKQVRPLSYTAGGHDIFNLPPPTQGVASLILLGVFDQLNVAIPDQFDFVHGIVEATKCAFRIRDTYITDPDYMDVDVHSFLETSKILELSKSIDLKKAAVWPDADPGGDTVWLGAIDGEGRAVSFIQSLYWEFGSGLVLPETGIVWQNRGISFSLENTHYNCLKPMRKPFHTIQPAMARLRDGRVMTYGTMGGEGQPQTQAVIFNRYANFNQDLQQSVSAPRWLLGRTWGSEKTSLRIENRFPPELIKELKEAGHEIEVVGPFEEVMGHAGAVVHHPNGLIEGASDPRSDGAAVGF